MKDPWVKAQIRKEFKRRRKELKSDRDRVQYELEKIAFANFADYTTPGGSIALETITRDQAAAILEVKVTKVEIAGQNPDPPKQDAPSEGAAGGTNAGSPAPLQLVDRMEPQPHGGALKRTSVEAKAQLITTKFKLQPKTTALKLLAQMHGALKEEVEHSGKLTVVVDL